MHTGDELSGLWLLHVCFEGSLDDSRYKLVLEDEVFNAAEQEEKDEKDGNVLNPCPFYELPEAGAVSGYVVKGVAKRVKQLFVRNKSEFLFFIFCSINLFYGKNKDTFLFDLNFQISSSGKL